MSTEHEQLWDVLSKPVGAEAEASKPSQGRFLKDKDREAPPPNPRRIDGFFLACMAGVAAVSVALTLLLTGPAKPAAPAASQLEQENAQLLAQLETQKKQIKDLQKDLMRLMGTEAFLSTVPSGPDQRDEALEAQVEAYELLAQIQEAYADFDRETLEELIPQMDKRLGELSPDALTSYYMILEYVEQPSNG